ncbi:hypothetical protein [Streptomyces laurentii]|uniref:hypothetical protein n=1 Tax=Streptomyces laurentii TaxID=39478 RepID=UPI00368CE5C6
MMLELLPGVGVTLPDGAGTLRFGTGPAEAGPVLATAPRVHHGLQCASLTRAGYPELRHAHDAWLSGVLFDPVWNTVATFGDVMLTVAGGGPGRTDRLAAVRIDVRSSTGTARRTTSVVWDGVDLFGHPARDVVSVLPEPRHPGSPPGTDTVVEPLGLWLGGRTPADDRFSQLFLIAAPTGWEQCCAGTFTCEEGGDGLTGIFH